MRNHWRLLLLRCYSRSHSTISIFGSQFQVHSSPNSRSFSSLLHPRAPHVFPPSFGSQSQSPKITSVRFFSSSELAIEHKGSDQVGAVIEVFSKPETSNDDIKMELESNNVVISHDLVLKVLKNPDTSYDVARRFFDWISERENERLSSKSYNLMLGILGVNGYVKEFWDLVGIMKKKGYGVLRATHVRVSEKFEKEGRVGDLEKLKELFASGSIDNSIEKMCSRVSKVIRKEVWGDKVEKQLRELNIPFSSNLVTMVLENIGTEPNKALIFFRWIEESNLLEHGGQTYNAMVGVLGREDCLDKFWRVVDEMKVAGYEMERGTYLKVLGRFIKRKMIKDAVDLYEFALNGANKPSEQDCTFLLRKIVVDKELDMDLFLKVVKAFTNSGNLLKNSTLDAVLKSLISVGRFGECNNILKAMKEVGFLPGATLQSKIAFRLSSDGEKDRASEFLDTIEASGCNPNYKMWLSLVEGNCVAGDLDHASACLKKMVEKEGAASAGYALQPLVNAYCRKNRAVDACKLLSDLVTENELKPWHPTYKVLISDLLVHGGFKEALNLLGLMKNQGFPPFLDPFIKYLSKKGTADDAMMFLKAITSERFPSASVFLNVFEAYFKAGRKNEAQDLLSRCPGYIRNNADVLNLFFSMKSAEAATVTAVAA
ncbi:pentatricopeptide repeat-containing protein At3g02490, mitochondrial-like [Cornus florida]|uniref:pentatricopeptide repeat-containing protein At3g02490, mitochondrial-like n=1 Tax=Cornus florida TaxID=4283 RepID=UPI00289CF043|nr:pentatricopeptide repeat-containing protein At3g02490, mitochondrial-like [Cornus florida]